MTNISYFNKIKKSYFEFILLLLIYIKLFIGTISNTNLMFISIKFSVLVLIFSFILYSYKTQFIDALKSQKQIMLLIFPILFVFHSENVEYGLWKSANLIVNTIPSIIFVTIILNTDMHKKVKLIMPSLVTLSLFLSLLIIFFYPIDQTTSYSFSIDRFSHVMLSRILFYNFIIMFFYFFSLKKTDIFTLFLLTTVLATIFLTALKAASIGIIILIIVFSIWKISQKEFATTLKLFIIPLLTAIMFIYIFGSHYPNALNRYSEITESIKKEEIIGGSMNDRVTSIKISWELFKEKPIAGSGFGGYRGKDESNYYRYGMQYPHNLVLEIISEMGILGIILFGFIFYNILKNLQIGFNLPMLIFIGSLWLAMFSKDISTQPVLWLYIIKFRKTKKNNQFTF